MASEIHPALNADLVAQDDHSKTQPGAGGPQSPVTTAWGKNGNGYRKVLDEAEVKETNVRILGNIIRFKTNPIVMPREQPMPLVLLRIVFNELKKDHFKKSEAGRQLVFENEEQREMAILASSRTPPEEDRVPTVSFARAFERLFHLLRDNEAFDYAEYDPNSDGYVTWAEFFCVYRKRNITVKWSFCERVFYTLEDPDSSIAATFLSFFVLMVIVVSSFCFIFSTVPFFQENPDSPEGPKPMKVLTIIDSVCLAIFVVEYLARLLTCWNVRTEISRKNQNALVALVVGYGPISLPSSFMRVIYFFFAPANLVDLVAILPGVLSVFVPIDGGGFVVLRLIRLTRLFRVFRTRSLIEPVIIIGRTLSQSTSALNILMFNLLLGVVISGSLIYIVEGLGTWDVENQVYLRAVGQEWNMTAGRFVDTMDSTPFSSIPHSFWWSLVTIMTVGYGDHYPTTGLGKVVAAGTMLFSLVMLALPVGVVGGNFSQVWSDFEKSKTNEHAILKQEQQFVVTQMAKLDPDRLRKMMLIEVWDDSGVACDGVRQGPRWNYFMGQATCHLDLPLDVIHEKEVTLKLENNPDIVDRKVKGSVAVKYKWTPHPKAPNTDENVLQGSLKVTIVSGRGLLNLVSTGSGRKNSSSPHCWVYVYPTRPAEGTMLTPTVWRTPTCPRNLSPIWNVTDTFEYDWKSGYEDSPKVEGRLMTSPVTETLSCRESPRPEDKLLDEALMVLQSLYCEMNAMKETISTLDQRVGKLAEEETERLEAEKALQLNGSGIVSTAAMEEESEDGEVPESEPRDMSSVGSEESV